MDKGKLKKILAGFTMVGLLAGANTAAAMGGSHDKTTSSKDTKTESGKTGCSGKTSCSGGTSCSGEKKSDTKTSCSGGTSCSGEKQGDTKTSCSGGTSCSGKTSCGG